MLYGALRSFLLTVLVVSVGVAQDRTGVLLIGNEPKAHSGEAHDMYWTKTRVSASFIEDKLVIKAAADLIPTPVGGMDELILFGTKETKFMGGGAKLNQEKGRGPGINGLNVMLISKGDGVYQGEGHLFYPMDGNDVQVFLVLFDDK